MLRHPFSVPCNMTLLCWNLDEIRQNRYRWSKDDIQMADEIPTIIWFLYLLTTLPHTSLILQRIYELIMQHIYVNVCTNLMSRSVWAHRRKFVHWPGHTPMAGNNQLLHKPTSSGTVNKGWQPVIYADIKSRSWNVPKNTEEYPNKRQSQSDAFSYFLMLKLLYLS